MYPKFGFQMYPNAFQKSKQLPRCHPDERAAFCQVDRCSSLADRVRRSQSDRCNLLRHCSYCLLFFENCGLASFGWRRRMVRPVCGINRRYSIREELRRKKRFRIMIMVWWKASIENDRKRPSFSFHQNWFKVQPPLSGCKSFFKMLQKLTDPV